MPIYTRTGDKGKTSLFGGKRVLKCSELVDVYGSIDELNSWVGLIASYMENADVQQFLFDIQRDLFVIGSTLAGWKGSLDNLPVMVKQMEERIDLLDKELPELSNFILPGGTSMAARIHVARGIARRVERQIVQLAQKQTVDDRVLTYVNRLSDLLFMLARFINYQSGIRETPWKGIGGKPDELTEKQ